MSKAIDFTNEFNASEITAVHISCSLGELTVCPSPDEAAHVRCMNVPEGSFAELADGTLKVEIHRPGILSTVFKNPFSNISCTVALPDKVYDSFIAEIGVGNSRIENISCNDARIETGTGNITIEGFRPLGALKLETGTGNVTADLPECGKVEVGTGRGNTSLSCCASGLTVNGGTGNIELSGTVNGEIILKGGIGNMSFDGIANGDLTAKGGIGNIDIRLHEDPENTEKHSVKTTHGIGKVNVEYVR